MNIDYEQLVTIPLTTEDINNIMKKLNQNPNIIILSELNAITDINQIFKNNPNIAIIFVATQSEYNGHWQGLIKDDDELYFFDSYGHNFTKLLNKVFSVYGKNAWGESYKLGSLIQNSGFFKNNKVLMNTIDYQSKSKSDATCGRHVLTLIYFYLLCKENNKEFNFKAYSEFIHNYMQNKNLKNPDYVVIDITEKIKNS